MSASDLLWGIDLGGTKIEGVVLSNTDKKVVARLRVPTEQEKGYMHILNQIESLIDHLSDDVGNRPHQIGIGTPGTLDPVTLVIKNSNTTCLNGTNIKEDLEDKVNIPFRIANDANCFALAEYAMGAVHQQYPKSDVVFGVIMGTGVGGGLVVNGQAIHGKQGIAGEWGHNHLDDSGGPCYCGKHGCVETVISGPALERFYTIHSGAHRSLREIAERNLAGKDVVAAMTIDRLLEQFGKAITVVINILDPDVIVLGGGVGNIQLLYTEGIERVKKYVFNKRLDTIFLPPALGDSAGVFGAAMLNEQEK